MKQRIVADLSGLPMHGRGSQSATWWGTLAFMLLEGMGFALAVAIYLYLFGLAPEWPLRSPQPDLGPGTVVTLLLLASVVPNVILGRWAHAENLTRVRIGLIAMSLLGIAPLIVRVYEFGALNVSWDTNAYGSVLWLMLGLHTTHLVTDIADTLVLTVLMFTRHGPNGRRFGDVEDNALYWNFVVLTWLPLYLCIYWVPRL